MSTSKSSSRLSPLAQPFILDRSMSQPSPYYLGFSPSDSIFRSFSELNFEGKGSPVFSAGLDAYGCHGPSCETNPPAVPSGIEVKSSSQQNPVLQFLSEGDFDAPNVLESNLLPLNNDSLPICSPKYSSYGKGNDPYSGKDGKRMEFGGSLHNKENKDGCSSTDDVKHGSNDLKPAAEALDGFHRGRSGFAMIPDIRRPSIFREEGFSKCGSFLMPNSEVASFSTSNLSYVESAKKVKNSADGQPSFPPSLMAGSNFCSHITSYQKYSSQSDSCLGKCAPVSIEKDYHLADLCGLSSAYPNHSHFNSFSSGITDQTSSSLSNTNGLKNAALVLGVDTKMINHPKSLIVETKEKHNGKPLYNERGNSLMEKCGSNIICCDNPELDSHCAEAGVSVKKSSLTIDDDDSDVDSPCWKGSMTSHQPAFESSIPVCAQPVEKGHEKCSNLNPLAPQFYPGKPEGCSHSGNERIKDVSSNSKTPLTFNVSLVGSRFKESIKAGVPTLELRKGNGIEYPIEDHEAEKTYDLLDDPKSNSMLNYSRSIEPYLTVDCLTLHENLSTPLEVEDSKKGIQNGKLNELINLAKDKLSSPSSSKVGDLMDLIKELQGVSESSSTPPKVEVQRVLNAMLVLSEMLAQNCSNAFYACYGHEYNIVQSILNNLCAFTANYTGQRTPMLDSAHVVTQCHLGNSELYKHSNMGSGVVNTSTMAVPYELHAQDKHERHETCLMAFVDKELDVFSSSGDLGTGQGKEMIQELHLQNNGRKESSSTVFSRRGACSFSSYSGLGTDKGKENVQAFRRNIEGIQDFDEHMDQQALLYRKLWLDAEAALCSMKLKAYIWCVKNGNTEF